MDGTGNALANFLTGNSGNNKLTGLGGNDTLDGGGGVDAMAGGSGDDIYIVDETGDAAIENANEGADTVQSAATFTLAANVENLTLTGGAAVNATGNAQANALKGNSAANVLDGAAGVDTMSGGAGDDVYILDTASDIVTENANEGTDTVRIGATYTLGANLENLTLTGAGVVNGVGNERDNIILGNSASNTLTGNAGNDTLDGGAGADAMTGGIGNDTYGVDHAGDVVIEKIAEGTDSVVSAIAYTLGANLENLTLAGAAGSGAGNELDNVITGNTTNNTLAGFAGNDTLIGGGGTDTLSGGLGNDTYEVDDPTDTVTEQVNEGGDAVRTAITYTLGTNVENLTLIGSAAVSGTGNASNNVLIGNGAGNTLSGLVGNDTLDGGAGADTMYGGAGDDLFVVDNAGDMVVEVLGEGVDRVQSSVSYTLTVNVEHLTLIGTADLTGTGNALPNIIQGNSGGNVLNGAGGADTLAGGAGNDAYYVDDAGDLVTENPIEGADIVHSALTYALGANLENLRLIGSAAINGTGNELANAITGNGAPNTLTGNAGNDRLDGSSGADALRGGTGDDTYVVDQTGDVVIELAGEGTDTVESAVTYALGANVERLTLIGAVAIDGSGNALDNVLDGNSALNRLSGGAGNDTYVVDNASDIVIENLNEGTDTVQSFVTYTLAPNVERLTLLGAAAVNGTGNASDNVLTGNGAANNLVALAGNDTLDGGAGVDVMQGGLGDDLYILDSPADIVLENVNEGTDTVQSSASYALHVNVEKLMLTGAGAINGTGNDADNVLTGNAANNTLVGGAGGDTLNGGAGTDTLRGGIGNDVYVLDTASDVVVENPNEGADVVQVTFSYTLGANVENLTLTGSAAITATGNDLSNVLKGNAAANTLNGGGGADAMSGGAGDDLYVVDHVGDTVAENANEGTDTVQTTVSYTLGANVENLTLTGSAAIAAAGNDLANVLKGNAAANTLNGGGGADAMSGGTGDDVYVVDHAGDIVTENANEGVDTVQSAIAYTLGNNVEKLTLTGTAAVSGTGNALDNVLSGNSAVNTLSGKAGNDTYIVDNVVDVINELAGEGIDTVQSSVSYTLGANLENLTLTGTTAISGTGTATVNTLIGNGAANTLVALAGNDTLDGGAGVDVMQGGLGDDLYILDSPADIVLENVNEGTDTVQSSASYALHANVENLMLTGAGAINGAGNDADNVLTGNVANNTLVGGLGGDTLNGGAGTDTLRGGAGNDIYVLDSASDVVVENPNEGTDVVQAAFSYTLGANVESLTLLGSAAVNGTGNDLANVIQGNSAANVLNGGAANDTLIGAGGDDTYVVDSASDGIVENLNEGTDTVQSTVSYTLGANVEKLTLIGSAAINGTGNTLNNVLTGNGAVNTLAGKGGDDQYFVDPLDIIVEAANEGTADTVYSAVTYVLIDNVENLTLTGSAAVNGTGTSAANVLVGNGAVNTLTGRAGNDTYVVQNTADVVVENANEGADTVQSTVSYTLSLNVENLTLIGSAAINGTGNDLSNVLVGNGATNTLTGGLGDDRLDGSAGADILQGGLGNDIYVVDSGADGVIENANEGVDTVQAAFSYTLGANVENLTLLGTAAVNGSGNTLANVITGNAAANALAGGGGNDRLDGAAGADAMSGNAGDDTYVVDHTGDLVIEKANEGRDVVQSAISYALGADVEDLTLTGAGTINGTGNSLVNVIAGNAARNTLDGMQGADTMIGGGGDDTYRVDNAADVVRENANEGADVVEAAVTYTLPDNVEKLVLLQGAQNGTGNVLDNTLIGNAAVNVLNGGAGNDRLEGGAGVDTMAGGTGDDTYYVQDTWQYIVALGNDGVSYTFVVPGARDVVTENANEGVDTVYTPVSYALSANIENLVLTEEGYSDWIYYPAFYNPSVSELPLLLMRKAIGNDANNTLTGSSRGDWLQGGAGNDTLDGGAGVDWLSGGPGDDTYIVESGDSVDELANQGVDTVMAAVSYHLGDNVEKLTLTGTAPIDGSAGSGDNAITGNDGDNWIKDQGGVNTLRGGGGNDLLYGSGSLFGDAGNDVLQGSLTPETLMDGAGNNLFIGFGGVDALTGGAGRELFIGGSGADTITTGAGADIVVFNRGDGQDVVAASTGADNTISIGGGIRYGDMTFTKSANNLVLNLGAGDQITLKDWYAAPANKSVLNMQVIAEAMADFDAASADKLRNRKVANFDFLGLAAAYDAAGAPASWALMNALLSKHLGGSDTAALGADLAYRYGRNGSLTGMGFDPVQGMLAAGSFGSTAQALQSDAALMTGTRRLS